MKKAIAAALVLLAMTVVAASAQGGRKVAHSSAAGYSCSKTITMPLVTPITGGAGFLGAEQASWAKYAIKTLAPGMHLKVKFVTGDTPVEAGPAPAQTLAQKYVGDPSVLVILGPSTSGAVAASTKTYYAAKIAHISPSATRTTLTKTDNGTFEGTPAFFRDVPGDYIQGPTDAKFMINNLHVSKVVIMDFQEPYSLGLAAAVDKTLKAGGVSTTRLSAPNTTTDYSAYVTKVPSDADIVFFPTQKPGDAQTFAQQLIEQGKKAKVFGGDGSNDASQFKVPGSYVSNFAPDISGIKADAGLIGGWKKDNPGKSLGSFGPPSYGAVQIALNAIKIACEKGHGSATRQSVFQSMKKVSIKNWILGGSFKWSTKSNDPLNAKFYIFQIQSNGSYKLVG
jgi:branched-chain amino acid transport system substrate-binding protein